MSQKKVLILHATTSYLLLGMKLLGAFLLRYFLDVKSVGFINLIQAVTPVFSASTLGGLYPALRRLPLESATEQNRTLTNALAVNLLEGGVVLVLIFFGMAFSDSVIEQPLVVLVIAAFFMLAQRVYGVIESGLMSMSRHGVVAAIRFQHMLEVFLGIFAGVLFGVGGYLLLPAVGCVLVCFSLILSHKPRYRIGDLDWRLIIPTKYGLGIGAEKLSTAIAAAIDSLLLAILAGPAALASYYLGVTLRNAANPFVSSIFWTVWPDLIRNHSGSPSAVIWGSRIVIGAVLATFATLVLGGLVVEYLVTRFLPDYSESLQIILMTFFSLGPLCMIELDRTTLVVANRRINTLAVATWTKTVVFLLATQLLMRVGFASWEAIPIAVYFAVCIQSFFLCIVVHWGASLGALVLHCFLRSAFFMTSIVVLREIFI